MRPRAETTSAEIDLVFDARPDSLAAVRHAALGAAVAARLASEQIEALHVAVGEAATNAVEHAYGKDGGSLRLRTYRRGPVFCVEIKDHGRWREGRPRMMAGRGIAIMHALADEVEIAREASGTIVRLAFRAQPER